jgi:hypothetical protein
MPDGWRMTSGVATGSMVGTDPELRMADTRKEHSMTIDATSARRPPGADADRSPGHSSTSPSSAPTRSASGGIDG